ncbi:hypothetical protein B0H19DRAFT_1323957 [Mycena capillaripes]|nr:hypothetical protein B0H19DRAFT_1323957 [Mycena capillaripes]
MHMVSDSPIFLSGHKSATQVYRLRRASTCERPCRTQQGALDWLLDGVERIFVPIFCGEKPINTGTGCGCVVEGGIALYVETPLVSMPCIRRVAHTSRGKARPQTHYVFLPGALSPPTNDAKLSQPSDPAAARVHPPLSTCENMPPTRGFEQRSYDGLPLMELTHYLRPRTPPTCSTARTPEVACVDLCLFKHSRITGAFASLFTLGRCGPFQASMAKNSNHSKNQMSGGRSLLCANQTIDDDDNSGTT